MVELFINHIYRYHRVLDSIVLDRGPQFILDFWNEFCHILGVKLKLSMAYHAPTDRQIEIVNQHIAMQLQSFVNYF
jgi:hypothetical protein